MANIKYFHDLPNGGSILFAKVDHRGKKEGSFGYDDVSGKWLKVTRAIEYKRFAIRHDCDARCTNAKGRIMKCECACGGRNHGKGHITFICEAV